MNNSKKTYEYILFDLDGTLTNPAQGIVNAVQHALRHFGIEEPNQKIYRFIGPPLRVSFAEYYGMSTEDTEIAVSKYREVYTVTGLYENEMYKGIPELLSCLKANGKTLVVATSKPTIFANKILDHFDLSKYFTFICGCEMDGTRDKKSEVIAYALHLLKTQDNLTDLSKVVMVGDREHDILGAKENGLDWTV